VVRHAQVRQELQEHVLGVRARTRRQVVVGGQPDAVLRAPRSKLRRCGAPESTIGQMLLK
jgi:hypothetical protein